jgi:DNA-binding beta-propeller fold protein YncE
MNRRVMTGLALVLLGGLVGGVVVQTRRTGPVLRIVTVGRNPTTVAVDAQTGRAFVTAHIPNSHGDVLGIVDATSGRLLRIIPVGRDPFRVLVDPRRGRAVVANDEDGTVSVLDESRL